MLFATYNIQFGQGKDGEIDLERIARELGDADVIALQEVERFWERSLHLDEVEELSELFPDHYHVYGPGIDMNAGYRNSRGRMISRRQQFGNMLLSRYPILSSRNHLLYHQADDDSLLHIQRAAIEAMILTDRGPLRVVSTHFSHSSANDRARQLRQLQIRLAQAVTEKSVLSGNFGTGYWSRSTRLPAFNGDYVVMGDFNLEASFPEYSLFNDEKAPAELVDLAARLGDDSWTCVERDGNTRIDYVCCSPSLAPLARDYRVDQDAMGSDHQPVFVTFDIKPS